VERGFEPPPAAVLPCAASHRASCPSAATEHFGNEYRVIVQAAVCCIPIPHSRVVQPPYVLVLRGLIFRVMIPPLVFCSWSRLVHRLSKSRSNRSRGTIDQSPCIRCTYASCGWDPSSCVLCCLPPVPCFVSGPPPVAVSSDQPDIHKLSPHSFGF
jgi:hypothetical protein